MLYRCGDGGCALPNTLTLGSDDTKIMCRFSPSLGYFVLLTTILTFILKVRFAGCQLKTSLNLFPLSPFILVVEETSVPKECEL